VLSIPPYFRNHLNLDHHNEPCIEKHLLRNAFTREYLTDWKGWPILPNEVLWRRKEAFSDGVSHKGRSLYQILQEQIAEKLNIRENAFENDKKNHFEADIETEKYYYQQLFHEYFPDSQRIVPYYWMPKYTNATDPSARLLSFYNTDDFSEK